MFKKLLVITILTVLFCSVPTLAKSYNNSLSISGSLYFTFLNAEYERRFGDFALATEAGFALIDDVGFACFNIPLRYYIDLGFWISPYITIAPGLALGWVYDTAYGASPKAVLGTLVGFNGYTAAGVEIKYKSFRMSVESGYGLMVFPEIGPTGSPLVKTSLGVAF